MTCFEIFWLKYEQQRERKFSEKPHKSVNNESDSNVAFQNRSCDTTIPFTKRKKENISCESHPVCNVASINSACNTYISSKGPQGRAGNIMFEIAALIGVAKRRGFTPQSRYNHYIFKWFEMPRIYVNVPAVNEKNVGEVKYGTYQKEVESLDCGQNWTLGGYRCSWKYFNNAKDEVRKREKWSMEHRSNACAGGPRGGGPVVPPIPGTCGNPEHFESMAVRPALNSSAVFKRCLCLGQHNDHVLVYEHVKPVDVTIASSTNA
ncbi:hypothetical protein MAR_027837 [Mya arenaria]|uniref:Uncharacterized protein n=1 Tax=Mya arenaria TaxID=6604 RepID=A0ABY7EUN0_MYAAR|nr:hypothetical protein MAR_027837 [Mya arenaria]